jgi:hypothetical protein
MLIFRWTRRPLALRLPRSIVAEAPPKASAVFNRVGAMIRTAERIHVWGGGMGHFAEYEEADEFSRLVIGFLEAE